ncbi:MAG: amino acid adenylation domain-containing protein, partial [Acidobacteria bacterium]|nr:amino acid adenylation domain-containing protein [Acidobacteriota bacterium]
MYENKNIDDNVMLFSAKFLKQREYWKNQLTTDINNTDICFDSQHKSKRGQKATLNRTQVELTHDTYNRLLKLGKQSEFSNYIILLAALKTFIYRYTGNNDITVVSPLNALNIKSETINNFVYVRDHIQGDMTFKELILKIKETILQAYNHQDYPIGKYLEYLFAGPHGKDDKYISNILCSLNTIHSQGNIKELEDRLSFLFHKEEKRMICTISYDSSAYEEYCIDQIKNHFIGILEHGLRDVNTKILEIPFISSQEKKRLIFEFNNTGAAYSKDKTIRQLFEEQVERTPGHIALVGTGAGGWCMDTGEVQARLITAVTYAKLNKMADILAGRLLSRGGGAGTGTIAAIMTYPMLEMMIAIFAVLKTGACYLPIDPGNPKGRIAYLLKDSEARFLLTHSHYVDIVDNKNFKGETLYINDECLYWPGNKKAAKTGRCGSAEDPVYIIYTSGTTGNPKGVLITHANVVNYVTWFSAAAGNLHTTKAVLTSSFAFDLGYTSIYPTLLNGAQLHLLSRGVYMVPELLLDYIHVHEIGFMKLSPSLLSIIVADNHFTTRTCRTLTLLVLGGEPIQVEDVEKAYRVCPHLKVMNHYGPTETTVGCIARFVEKGALDTFKKRPTIGKPIFNTKIYILDNYLNLLPPGLAGGLYIGGEGVGMGYLNNPELTAEKFIMPSATRNPFEKGFLDLPKLLINNQSPLYRTGDSARWLPDGPPAGGDSGGVIEFLGRIDRQMKIRGYRIELGEIENRLLSHSDIKKACVLTKEGAGSNQQYLVAYIIAGKKFAVSELREYLSTELPDYMIPSFFVQVEDFPLTPNGKINVKAFPGPPALAGSEYIAPRNEIEEKLAGIWRAVLGGDTAANSTANPTRSIGIDDNFFELGGHSLRATILVSRIHKTFNVKLPLAEVFSTPTIRGLAKYINGTIIEKYEEIHPVECKEYYKLSSVQHRLYFLQQMDPAGTVYDMPVLIPLAEDADLGKVEEALKKLIRRHESLRTSFHIINNETVQRVHTRVEFAIEKIDFTAHPGEVIKSFFHPFDLSKAPLMRVGFFRTGEGKRFLMITLHHIITDGISQLVLNRDFISYYKGDDLPALRLHYKDFSEWQNSQEHTGKLVSQEAYWLKEFAGEIPVLNLPQDFPRPALQSFEGNFLFFNLNPVHYAGLQRMAKTENVTMFMILLSVTNVLLSKLGDSEDIITGTPIAGRRHPDLEKIIGMFVNTLALRNYPVGRKNFREFLQEIKDRTLKAFENQEYQFEDLVAKVLINRDRGRNPLFDVMFVVQNYTNKTPMEEGGPRLENQLIDKQNRESYNYTDILRTSRFDLTIAAREEDQGRLTLTVEYCTKLFKKKTIERFIAYFQEIIAGVVEEPGAILSQIEIIPEAEKQWLLFDLNRTRMAYPQDKTIHQLFDEQGERNPDRVVVVGEIPAGQMQITHRKVNNRSNHIASLVKSKGLARGSIIGIMTEPRLETVIGIAGILKAGCTFLPLEPGSPPERVNFALKDSNTSLLLTQGHLKVKAAIKANIASINLEDHSLDNNILESPNIVSDLSEPVYVIYTSGTSGRPKGVLITNKNIVNYAHWLVQTIPLTVDDRTILTSSLAFDLIYTSFFSFLFVGCQLHVIPRETYLFPGELISYLEKNKITYIKVTPSLFNIIVNSPGFSPGVLKTLRLVMLGGEQINVHDVEKAHLLCPHLRMMNHYGPTETTIGAIARFIDFEKFAAYKIAPTIGKPIHNVRVYILDKALHVVPLGVAGGLYLSGDGVGMGYLNNPELTCKKFRPQITQIKE